MGICRRADDCARPVLAVSGFVQHIPEPVLGGATALVMLAPLLPPRVLSA